MYLICKGNESKITMTKEKAKTVINSTYLDDIRVVEHPKGVLWDGNLNYNQSKFRVSCIIGCPFNYRLIVGNTTDFVEMASAAHTLLERTNSLDKVAAYMFNGDNALTKIKEVESDFSNQTEHAETLRRWTDI